MGFTWKEIAPNDHYSVAMPSEMSSAELISLTQLYQPLIGTLAVTLYMTLYHERLLYVKETSWSNHRGLMSLMGQSLDHILRAREHLEAIGLLRTMKVEEEQGSRHYEYILQKPISASSFFRDDMLSIILLNRVGKAKYEHLRKQLLGPAEPGITQGVRTEMTKSFDEVFDSISPSEIAILPGSESQQFLQQMEDKYPAYSGETIEPRPALHLKQEDPDFDFLEASLPKFVQQRKFNQEQKETLRELAFFYHLDDMQLSYFLQDPFIYIDDNELDIERLRKLVKDSYTSQNQGKLPTVRTADSRQQGNSPTEPIVAKPPIEEEHKEALNRLSPIVLLEQYQGGSKVSPADLKIVDELTSNYNLQPGVINVLLEYVMLTNNKQLPPALIYKIATHWKRLGIQTVDQAKEQAKQLYQNLKTRNSKPETPQKSPAAKRNGWNTKKDELPEWVEKQIKASPKAQEELGEEQKKQAQELLRALGELD